MDWFLYVRDLRRGRVKSFYPSKKYNIDATNKKSLQ